MGTSADLAVVLGDKILVKHTSCDGFTNNMMSTIAPALVCGGLDNLRKNFAAAKFVDEEEEGVDIEELEYQIFRENLDTFVGICAETGYEPYELDQALSYDFGVPDFTHHGGGLLFGHRHINEPDFLGTENPIKDASCVLDLDKGELRVDWPFEWVLDLNAIQGKDAVKLGEVLSGFDYNHYDSLHEDGDETAAQKGNQALAEAVAAVPAFNPAAPAAPTESYIDRLRNLGASRGGSDHSDQVVFRFHPDDLVIARIIAQSFQMAAPLAPEVASFANDIHIERYADCCGVVATTSSRLQSQLLEEVGNGLIKSFDSHVFLFSPGGGYSVRHRGGGMSSSASFGHLLGMDEQESQNAPRKEDLSQVRTLEDRHAQRQEWIEKMLSGDTPTEEREQIEANLYGELFVALVLFDAKACQQLFDPRLGLVLDDDLAKQAARLAAEVLPLEALFNPQGVRQRIQEQSSELRSRILGEWGALDRKGLEARIGPLERRKPRSP